MADFLESFAQLQMELEQHKPSEEDPNRWTYPALKASVQAVCNASDSHVKQLFHTAVEFSRACTQAGNTPMPPPGEGASAALKAPSYQAPALGGQLTEDVAILESCGWADRIICAWGSHGEHLDRGRAVEALLRQGGWPLYHLGLTKHGQPKHPLYIAYTEQPRPWVTG